MAGCYFDVLALCSRSSEIKILDVLTEHIPEAATGFNIIFSYPCG